MPLRSLSVMLAKSALVPLAPPWMAMKVWLRGTVLTAPAAAGAAVAWAGAWVGAAAAGAVVAAGLAGACVGAAAGAVVGAAAGAGAHAARTPRPALRPNAVSS